jgi:hypothetical protein
MHIPKVLLGEAQLVIKPSKTCNSISTVIKLWRWMTVVHFLAGQKFFLAKQCSDKFYSPFYSYPTFTRGSLLGVKWLGYKDARSCKSTTLYNFKLQYLIKHNFVFSCP